MEGGTVNGEFDKQEASRVSPRLVAKGNRHEMSVADRRIRQSTEMVSTHQGKLTKVCGIV